MSQPEENSSVYLEEVYKDAFVEYASSVNFDRAIPDVRDGLKPVQRCILYAMHVLKLNDSGIKARVAKVAADTSGNYHPHGDAAAADALYRLGQDWVMRYPLVHPFSAFGGIDEAHNPSPRYPDCGLSKYGQSMMGSDLHPDIVPFRLNYDETKTMPEFLPSLLPNAIVNAQSGIGVANACTTAPHNLRETVAAIKLVAKKPKATVDDILSVMPGPDFPNQGYVFAKNNKGEDGIRSYYETGTGTFLLQGKAEVMASGGGQMIVITDLPYGIGSGAYTKSIGEMVSAEKIDGIADIKDLGGKGVRIEIEVKKGHNATVVLNRLYKHTNLRTSYSVNMNMIDPSSSPPRTRMMSIKDVIEAYIDHRIGVIIRRCEAELLKCQQRLHIVEGLIKALGSIDLVIKIIRGASDRADARAKLRKEIDLSPDQAESILDMRLVSLTRLAIDDLKKEMETLNSRASELIKILGDRDEQIGVMCSELDEMASKIGDDRNSVIVHETPENISLEDLIEKEEMVVVITTDGYIKRVPLSSYKTQARGGKGVLTKDEEQDISQFIIASTHDQLLLLTQSGQFFHMRVLDIDAAQRNGKGINVRRILGIDDDEIITSALIVRGDFDDDRFVVTCTKKGLIKKTPLSDYTTKRLTGVSALKLDDGDTMEWAMLTDGNQEFFLTTKNGFSLRFSESEVRPCGRMSKGVRAIRLMNDDSLISCISVDPKAQNDILAVSEQGKGKRTKLSEYRLTSRGGKGVTTMNTTQKTGPLVSVLSVSEDDKVMILSSKGRVAQMKVSEINRSARVTQGVIVSKLSSGDTIIGVSLVAKVSEDG